MTSSVTRWTTDRACRALLDDLVPGDELGQRAAADASTPGRGCPRPSPTRAVRWCSVRSWYAAWPSERCSLRWFSSRPTTPSASPTSSPRRRNASSSQLLGRRSSATYRQADALQAVGAHQGQGDAIQVSPGRIAGWKGSSGSSATLITLTGRARADPGPDEGQEELDRVLIAERPGRSRRRDGLHAAVGPGAEEDPLAGTPSQSDTSATQEPRTSSALRASMTSWASRRSDDMARVCRRRRPASQTWGDSVTNSSRIARQRSRFSSVNASRPDDRISPTPRTPIVSSPTRIGRDRPTAGPARRRRSPRG